MDIKSKANDIKINEFPASIIPNLVRDINLAISESMNQNTKLTWSEDLKYEVVEYKGSIYKDKASEYGKDSLYVLIRVKNELSDDPRDYTVLAVWQNKKFLGKANTSYKSISAIFNNDFYLRSQKAFWLIIKNPKMIDYSYRREDNKSPQQQKDMDINQAYKRYNSQVKEKIGLIKDLTQDTILENDNPLEIIKNIANKIFANPNQKWDVKDKEIENYVSGVEKSFYRIRNLYSNLIDSYMSLMDIISPENPINQLKIDEAREDTTRKIKANKDFPEKPEQTQIIDKSGYVINLSKWLEKKWDKFKNSNNLLQSLAYEMQSEYNDLIFETKVTVKELINSDEAENWIRVQQFSNFVVIFKNELNSINKDIEQFIDFYAQNNEPIDTNSFHYRRIIKDIKKFITEVKEQKQEVF